MTAYKYEPLQPGHIRILFLHPGETDDPLHGSLETFPIEDDPTYTAISYAWGEEIFPHQLHLREGYLQITDSLYGALRTLRSQDCIIRLWADQVCIAQHNVTEKNHQVDVMANIYRKAEEVVAWLGNAQESDCLAYWTFIVLATIRDKEVVDPRFQSVVGIGRELPEYLIESRDRESCEPSNVPGCSSDQFDCIKLDRALHSLMDSIWGRSWFERLWVVQEVSVASLVTVRFGHHALDFEDLYDVATIHLDAIDRDHSDFQIHETAVLRRRRRMFGLKQTYGGTGFDGAQWLLRALVKSQGLASKEDHDRIYALRALARIETIEALKPNYEIAISELWVRATVVMLTAVSAWDIEPNLQCEPPALALALVGTQELSSTPSWALDGKRFTEQSQKTCDYYVEEAREVWAGSKSSLDVLYRPDVPELVHLRGVLVCRVLAICPESRYETRLAKRRTNQLQDDPLTPARSALRYDEYYRFTRRQPFAGSGELHRESFFELMIQGSPLWKSCNGIVSLCTGKISSKDFHRQQEFFGVLEKAVPLNHIDCTRVLASTSTGHFGWIPNTSQPNDVVCIFQGGPFPFVVRERGDGFFTLLGDCYVQGIMHGEFWPANTDDTCMIGLK